MKIFFVYTQVILIDPSDKDEMEFWDNNNANLGLIAKNSSKDKKATAHVCQDFICSAPVTDLDALRLLLSKKTGSTSSS